jgi:hypothetical protein
MADNSELIASFPKNSTEEVRISIDEFKGRKLVNVRVWYLDRDTDEMRPGKQGFALSTEKFNDLYAALELVKQKLGG